MGKTLRDFFIKSLSELLVSEAECVSWVKLLELLFQKTCKRTSGSKKGSHPWDLPP